MRKKKATRRKNPNKEYVIFSSNGNTVWFLTVNSQWTGRGGKGKFITGSKMFAKKVASIVGKRNALIGVADKTTTNKQIIAFLPGKA